MKQIYLTSLVVWIGLTACTEEWPTTRVTVKVADTFKGTVRLTPCIPTAQAPAVVDDTGNGVTSACPVGPVELAIIAPSKTIIIPAENVTIRRASDNMPLSISAHIP
jgi:hypothetical protein